MYGQIETGGQSSSNIFPYEVNEYYRGGPLTVCPDLAKFRHFGKKIKISVHFWYGLISIWQTFLPNIAIFYASRQIIIVENGRGLNNNLAIWSHCP